MLRHLLLLTVMVAASHCTDSAASSGPRRYHFAGWAQIPGVPRVDEVAPAEAAKLVEASLAPNTLAEFASGFLGRRVAYWPKRDANMADLLDGLGLDEILEHYQRSGPASAVIARHEGDTVDHGIYGNGPHAQRLLADGTSLVVNFEQLKVAYEPIERLRKAVVGTFGTESTIHAYVSPPSGARALNPHTDTYDVLVFHLQGVKRWKWCVPRIDSEMDQASMAQAAEFMAGKTGCAESADKDLDAMTCVEQTLLPGDFLYLPRGVVHAANAGREGSMHLTVSLSRDGSLWADLLGAVVATPQQPFDTLVFLKELARLVDPQVFVPWSSPLPMWVLSNQYCLNHGDCLEALARHFRTLTLALATDGALQSNSTAVHRKVQQLAQSLSEPSTFRRLLAAKPWIVHDEQEATGEKAEEAAVKLPLLEDTAAASARPVLHSLFRRHLMQANDTCTDPQCSCDASCDRCRGSCDSSCDGTFRTSCDSSCDSDCSSCDESCDSCTVDCGDDETQLGRIVGIVIGVLFVLALVGGAIFLFMRYKARRRQQANPPAQQSIAMSQYPPSTAPANNNSGYPGYPAPGGYPGYPPQAGAPGAGAAGYPPTGYPPTGYPPQAGAPGAGGYPPTGYPPQQGYPPANAPPYAGAAATPADAPPPYTAVAKTTNESSEI